MSRRPAARLAVPLPVLVPVLLLALLLAAAAPVSAAPQPPPGADRPASAGEAAGPPHPFYLQLLEEGVQDWQRGDPAAAVEDLRLAVFGLLDHPPQLVRGLAYLALAQAAAGDGEAAGEAVAETLGRLVVVADRFRAYGAAGLPAPVRARLEALLAERVAEATLTASPTFRELGDRRFLERVATLPPAERRAALEQRAARQPAAARWQLALGALDLEAGEPSAAAGRAAAVLAADPDPASATAARCLRGRALASTGACASAVADLEACPGAATDAATAGDLVACQVQLGAWREAAAALGRVPPELRERGRLERLDRQVRRQLARRPPEEPGTAVATGGEAADGPGEVRTTPAQDAAGGTPGGEATTGGRNGDAPAAALPPDAREQLQEARVRMAAATRAGELAEPLRTARRVADAHPGSAEAQHLVGEIAYRASEWEEAVRYFRRGGEPRRPEHRFYLAVSLFESGDVAAAAAVLERTLPELPRNPFVDSYVERILGDAS